MAEVDVRCMCGVTTQLAWRYCVMCGRFNARFYEAAFVKLMNIVPEAATKNCSSIHDRLGQDEEIASPFFCMICGAQIK